MAWRDMGWGVEGRGEDKEECFAHDIRISEQQEQLSSPCLVKYIVSQSRRKAGCPLAVRLSLLPAGLRRATTHYFDPAKYHTFVFRRLAARCICAHSTLRCIPAFWPERAVETLRDR